MERRFSAPQLYVEIGLPTSLPGEANDEKIFESISTTGAVCCRLIRIANKPRNRNESPGKERHLCQRCRADFLQKLRHLSSSRRSRAVLRAELQRRAPLGEVHPRKSRQPHD